MTTPTPSETPQPPQPTPEPRTEPSAPTPGEQPLQDQASHEQAPQDQPAQDGRASDPAPRDHVPGAPGFVGPPAPGHPAQGRHPQGQFPRRERPLPANPRRVRGGLKLASKDGQLSEAWPAQRWLRVFEAVAPGASMRTGLEYATLGQTKRLGFEPGRVEALVQGRASRAYAVQIAVETIGHDPWEGVLSSMADQAIYAAKLLSGEVPASIEDLFAPLDLKLFPTEAVELTPSCTCKEPDKPWCKHVCCAAMLAADRLASDPFLIFLLRGLDAEELLERLRQQRVTAGAGDGSTAVVSPIIPGATDLDATPLDECVDSFWDIGPELRSVDLSIEPPEVTHPLLRRLGPSPFGTAKFPLVGLLATCYELISEAALNEESADDSTDESTAEEAENGDPERSGGG